MGEGGVPLHVQRPCGQSRHCAFEQLKKEHSYQHSIWGGEHEARLGSGSQTIRSCKALWALFPVSAVLS